MKRHFVKTENYQRLIDGAAFMEARGSLTACLCLVHGEPGVGKTRNVSKWGPDAPAIFVKGHVGMTLDGLIWSLSQGLGVPHKSNRTAEIDAQIRALQASGAKLIFDEAQFGLKMKSGGTASAGIEHIRDLCERSGTYALLICHQSERAGFYESKHIRNRISHQIEMLDASLADTLAFARELCEVPIDDDIGAQVHRQSGGKYRLVENAVAALEQIAKVKGLPRLCGDDVRKYKLVVDHEETLVLKAVPAQKRVKPAAKEGQ